MQWIISTRTFDIADSKLIMYTIIGINLYEKRCVCVTRVSDNDLYIHILSHHKFDNTIMDILSKWSKNVVYLNLNQIKMRKPVIK